MSYITESRLLAAAKPGSGPSESKGFLLESRSSTNLALFLSHSHKDRELARGFCHILGSFGIQVYVDWNDSAMPHVTSGVTAKKIKKRIASSDALMVLATINALKSRWVPWEVGIADRDEKPNYRIFIVPVADSSGAYPENEYLQIYERVEVDALGFAEVFDPHASTGTFLRDILRAPLLGPDLWECK